MISRLGVLGHSCEQYKRTLHQFARASLKNIASIAVDSTNPERVTVSNSLGSDHSLVKNNNFNLEQVSVIESAPIGSQQANANSK